MNTPSMLPLQDLRILVVEDEELIAESLQERLEYLGAIVVGVVDTGREAIVSAQWKNPELILMDINLKDAMTGIEAAAEIREKSAIPIVFLTGHSDLETLQQTKVSDPFGYLFKPFSEADLISTIETATRRQELENQLSDSEYRFRAMLESLDEGVVSIDPDGSLSFLNPIAARLMGCDSNTVLGKPWDSVFRFQPERSAHEEIEFSSLLKSNEAVTVKGILENSLSQRVPISVTVSPILDSAKPGHKLGVVLTCKDLTEQVEFGQQMRHSEERIAAVFRNSPVAMTIVDLNNPAHTLDVNKSFEKMTMYTREQALKSVHPETSFWDSEVAFRDIYEEFRRYGRVVGKDFNFRRADGALRAGIISASPFTIGSKQYVLTSIMDITDRKETENLLRDSEQKFHAIFSQSFQFIGVLDIAGNVLEANETALRFANVSAADVIGKPFWETAWWSHSELYQEKLKSAVQRAARGEVVRLEVTHPDGEGRIHNIDFSLKPVKNKDGNITMLIPEGRDITELREMQTSLQISEAEKSELQASYLQSQKMEAVGRLAAGVAHDFNNLLTVINGYADLIDHGINDGEEANQLISEIRSAGQRASTLTKQLLAFSRKQVLKPKRVDLGVLVDELGHMLERLLGEDVILSLNIGKQLWPISVDPNQLEQVIVNLAVNARDAMHLGGTLSIEAENIVLEGDIHVGSDGKIISPGQYVVLRVSDNGSGMDPEIIGHIFEPFFTTKDQSQGTGLGLATVYGIINQSGGSIQVDSVLNQGTTFSIYLPGLASEEFTVSSSFETQPVATGSETILVVEDDPSVRELMTTGLSMLGYKIHAACNGNDALEILGRYDSEIGLMVTDVVMPGMSGGELAEMAKARFPSIKVLYLSGYNNDEIVKRGVIQGDARLLRKPFTIDEISQVVREELDSRPARST